MDATQIDEYRTEMYEVLVNAEVKGTDLEEIHEKLGGLFQLVKTSGVTKLPDYLEEQISSLIQLRQQPDRGARKNLAPWKVAAIATAVGVGIFNFIHCNFWGCTVRDWNGYVAGYSVLALVTLFC